MLHKKYARLLGERNSGSHSGLAGLQDDDIIKKIHDDKKAAIQDQGLSQSEKVVLMSFKMLNVITP